MELHWIDISIIVLSLLGVFAIGLYTACRRSNANSDDYFLSERSLSWWAVGASLFASNIGAEHFVGQSGAAAKLGIVVANYEWTAGFFLLMLGYIAAPVYLRLMITTVPEWVGRRFDIRCRVMFVAITIFVYTACKLAAALYAAKVFFETLFGWNMYLTIAGIVCATAAYVTVGGLDAVVYADVLQLGIFLMGGSAAAVLTLHKIGGIPGLYRESAEFHLEDGKYMHTWRDADSKHYSGPGLVFGMPFFIFWYWAVDQEMVQRALGAQTLGHARAGTIMAGFLKLFTPFLTVIPGMCARIFFEKCQRGFSGYDDWCETNLDDDAHADEAYARLVSNIMPAGMRGLIVATVLAAAMSSLSAVFNSASALLTMDVYKVLRPAATEEDCVWCGRWACVAMMLVSLGWIPIMETQHGNMYVIMQGIATHLVPPLTVTSLMGLLTRSTTANGMLCAMSVGLAVGIARLCVWLYYKSECDDVDTMFEGPALACLDFNIWGAGVCVFIIIIAAVFSAFDDPPTPSQLHETLVWSNDQGQSEDARRENQGLLDQEESEDNPITDANPGVASEVAKVETNPGNEEGLEKEEGEPQDPLISKEDQNIGKYFNVPGGNSGGASQPKALADDEFDTSSCRTVHAALAATMVTAAWLMIIGFGSFWFGAYA